MQITNKSIVCSGCNIRFSVDFSKKETSKTVKHECGKYQVVTPKK